MRRLIVYPSDPMQAYLDKGQTYEYYSDYFNPGGYFDEVYVLSPWGDRREEKKGKVTYIKALPANYKKIVKQIKPDVIRAYGGYHCADWLAMSRVEKIPTVVSVHDPNPQLIFDSVKYADNIIYMSQCVQNAVEKKIDCSNKGIYILGNRVNVDLYFRNENDAIKEKLDLKFGNGRHVLHIGRKSEEKNLDTLIRAIPLLPKDVNVVFVGQGNFESYESLANELGVRDRVFNIAHVDNVELPSWYSWCDCFCTPSRWEGFGCVFIEAACCETPIVTSDIAPMNEYLSNGENAILVEEYQNPVAIANAINSILSNGIDVEAMTKNARNVGKCFSKDIIDKKEIDIYKEIIEKGVQKRVYIPFKKKWELERKYCNWG